MKVIVLSAIFYLMTGILVIAQDVDEKQMVGYGCSVGGSPSKPVVKVQELLRRSDYHSLTKLLSSDNTAYQYLAVITLERLSELNIIELEAKEIAVMAQIKSSDREVSVCSGCTYWDTLPLKKLFNHDGALGSSYWLDNVITK
jgi:hypothetical protein